MQIIVFADLFDTPCIAWFLKNGATTYYIDFYRCFLLSTEQQHIILIYCVVS
jgi:hypothetical protein